jgi:hypothetical protein
MRTLRAFLACLLLAVALPAMASDAPPARLLFWHLEGDRVMVSNVRFSRTDEFRLRGRERIESTADAAAMLVLVTNQRYIAYSVYTASWQTISRQPGETLEQLTAEDYAAFVLTSRRVLNFNGRTANWSEGRR